MERQRQHRNGPTSAIYWRTILPREGGSISTVLAGRIFLCQRTRSRGKTSTGRSDAQKVHIGLSLNIISRAPASWTKSRVFTQAWHASVKDRIGRFCCVYSRHNCESIYAKRLYWEIKLFIVFDCLQLGVVAILSFTKFGADRGKVKIIKMRNCVILAINISNQ